MSDDELAEWAKRELELRLHEDLAIEQGHDHRLILRERGYRRVSAKLSRTAIRDALLMASMEWA